ncbi:MAG: hypothetical protein GC202_14255 [Alphaproteobacteria bacterium]|nr:hypothetical protein [Alphaproteobacteria bacterium]
MTTVDEIRTRLGSLNLFKTVEGAAELAAVKDKPKASPVAYVFVGREQSGENTRGTGGVLQRVERDISVVIVTSNLSDRLGAAAAAEIEALKTSVRASLIGWTPASMVEPLTHVNGELVEARDGFVWFEDVFSAPSYLEAT